MMQREKKSAHIENKLKSLPNSPGVYFHKDKTGEIIYVGKAAVLKNRVRQYFQNQKNMDVKTRALVAEIADIDWVETESEIDALFLEAELVKRYMPRYNILLRDDKSLIYVRIDMKSQWPFVSFTRHPIDDGADYFGPYFNGGALRRALRYLRRVFPYYTKPPRDNGKLDLDAHLGLSPVNMTTSEYKSILKKLVSYINGGRKKLVRDLEGDMKQAADRHDFEKAADIRNRLQHLRELQHRIMFGDKEFLDISKDAALQDLADFLNLPKTPYRIEGFDISHMSGANVVGSMVVFKNGVSDRGAYRKFKTRLDRNDDTYNMAEIISRRLSEKNIKEWGKPDLVLIDGGKGQLNAALEARNNSTFDDIPFIGIAKKEEQIIVKGNEVNRRKVSDLNGFVETTPDYIIVSLPRSSHIIRLLQRIRDESHRFAVSYHSSLKKIRQTASVLDEINGIGPKTKSKLIKKFGSVRGLKNVSERQIAKVIGPTKAKLVFEHIKTI